MAKQTPDPYLGNFDWAEEFGRGQPGQRVGDPIGSTTQFKGHPLERAEEPKDEAARAETMKAEFHAQFGDVDEAKLMAAAETVAQSYGGHQLTWGKRDRFYEDVAEHLGLGAEAVADSSVGSDLTSRISRLTDRPIDHSLKGGRKAAEPGDFMQELMQQQRKDGYLA